MLKSDGMGTSNEKHGKGNQPRSRAAGRRNGGSRGQVRRLKRQLSRTRAEIQTQQRAFANLWQEHKLLEAERDSARESRDLYMRLYERQGGTIDNLLTAIERLTDKNSELQKRLAVACPESSTAKI